MKKKLSIILLFVLFVSSQIYANCGCFHSDFKGGSFEGFREGLGPFPEFAPAILDLYVFNADRTASWDQSGNLFLPLNFGTDSLSIGTWKVKGKYLYLTTIDYGAAPFEYQGINDLTLSNWLRTTQKIKIIDKDTLKVLHRVLTSIDIHQDPLTAEGTVVLDSKQEFLLRKIKVITSDLQE